MGYVKLLGLPEVILWTPLIVDLIIKRRSNALPIWPMWIITIMIVITGIFWRLITSTPSCIFLETHHY